MAYCFADTFKKQFLKNKALVGIIEKNTPISEVKTLFENMDPDIWQISVKQLVRLSSSFEVKSF